MATRLLVLVLISLQISCAFFEKQIDGRRQKETDTSHSETSDSGDEEWRSTQIRSYEKKMSNRREKEHYSKLLPWFRNDKEKLEYLSLPTVEKKQEWALDNKIWARAKSPNQDMKDLIQAGDIAIGMPMDFVIKAWGEPLQREVSGNPLFKNEKWRYNRSISSQEGYRQEKRIVYFEGGRVVGWETE